MFEAVHSERLPASADAVWELWADPARWPRWDEQIESAEVEGDLAIGAELKTKLRRGGTVRHLVTALEPGRLLAYEARFPGARSGYEHRLVAGRRSAEVTHRRYIEGPLAGFWALMFGRKRLRESVERLAERERELLG